MSQELAGAIVNVWSAGRGEVVDVGVAAGGTVGLGVVCLAAVAGHRAAGEGASAVGGMTV